METKTEGPPEPKPHDPGRSADFAEVVLATAAGSGTIKRTSLACARGCGADFLLADSWTTAQRVGVVTEMLNQGVRKAEIARRLGRSRERIRQLIQLYIPDDMLAIPCQWCGRPMAAQWGLRHLYHKECAKLSLRHSQRQTSIRAGLQHWHQRNQPDGEFEAYALREYRRRGYEVCWAPAGAPFDYVVNGYFVDVKGSHLNRRGIWQFGMAAGHKYMPSWDASRLKTQMSERCDIVHLIGSGAGALQHYIIPAEVIGERTQVTFQPVPQPYMCEWCGMQFATEQGLQVHRDRWCGRTPSWHSYRDDWAELDRIEEPVGAAITAGGRQYAH